MMDNYIALDFLLAGHGGVYTVANTYVVFGAMNQARYNRLYVALRKSYLVL